MNVVITGGTRGIGRGLAEVFVARGHRVTLSGRTPEAVAGAVEALNAQGPGQAAGVAGDIADGGTAERLWQTAAALGPVDIWVNNAGMTHRKQRLAEVPPEELAAVAHANLTGLLNGCRAALAGMQAQGHGKIFNMEGFGSGGEIQPGLAVYGTTKHGVRYVTRALAGEYADRGVRVFGVNPGVVTTEFVTRDLYAHDPGELERRRRFLNLLGDRVETVAPALVDGMLAAEKNGSTVRWLTPGRAVGRLLAAPFRRRDAFAPPTGAG